MKLSPPKMITWVIALILLVLALLGHFNNLRRYPYPV